MLRNRILNIPHHPLNLRNPPRQPHLHLPNRLLQLPLLIQLRNLAATPNAPPLHQDVGDGGAACQLGEERLDGCPVLFLVELDDEGARQDVVGFEEDGFGALGVRAVGFGEYDD